MIGLNPTKPVLTLNINIINTSINRQISSVYIGRLNPIMCFLHETHFKFEGTR